MEESATPELLRPIRTAGVAKQVAASIVASLLTMNAGMTQGWMSPMTLVLTTDLSPVDICNEQDLANLSAIPTSAHIVLAFVVGGLANRTGRKKTLIVLGIASVSGGFILTFPSTKLWLYVGRAVAAFPLMGIMVSLMYVTETVQSAMRGLLVSLCTVSLNVGILISYTLGSKLSYAAFNSTFIVVPLIFTILIFWLPESPYYLVEKSQIADAKKSLLWLRGGNVEVVERELQVLKSSKPVKKESISITQIWKRKEFRSALFISVLAYGFQTMSGIPLIVTYSGLIFEDLGSPFSADDSAIVVACLILVASIGSAALIDKLGRKPLLYVSFFGGTLAMGVLAIFSSTGATRADFMQNQWVSLVTVGTFVVMYGMGLTSIPGVLMNELSSINTRATVGVVAIIAAVVMSAVSVQSFPSLRDHVGLYSVFVGPTVFNFFGIFFTWLMVPETKGKTLEQITDELRR